MAATVTNSDGQSSSLAGAVTYNAYYYVSSQTSGQIYGFSQDAGAGTLTALPGSPYNSGSHTYGLALDPNNRFLYGVNYGASTVMAFSIGANGALTQVGSVATGASPACAVATPVYIGLYQYLYVTNYGTTTISGYSINQLTGALTPLASFPLSTGGTAPNRIITDPLGQWLYTDNGSSGTISAWSIDSLTGALTPIAGSPFTVGAGGTSLDGMTTDSTGSYLYVGDSVASGALYFMNINSSTGALTNNASYSIGNAAGGAGVDVDPQSLYVYATNYGAGTVSGFSMNSDGSLNSLGPAFTAGAGPNDFSFASGGGFTYVANTSGNSLQAFQVQSNGTLTSIGTYAGIGQPGMTDGTK